MANYTPVNVQAGDLILASHINPMSAQVAENETNILSKQNTLVSGQNIKTINGVSLLGSGNITISGSSEEAGSGSAVLSVNGQTGDVILTATDVGAATSSDIEDVLAEIETKADKSEIPDISGKQNTLVSGTTIKTINGESLLGSGNITIQSGSGSTEVHSVNGKTGTVVLSAADVGAATLEDIPDISGKQDTLVSGTSIKTINGESLLGSGNIEIQSGGSGNEVLSVNGKTGAVVLTATDVGAATLNDISGKQDKLVPGTNIKTINGTSLLGSGNIIINTNTGTTTEERYYSTIANETLTEATTRFDVNTGVLSAQQYTDIIAIISTQNNSATGALRCNAYSSGTESSVGYITLVNAISATTSVYNAVFRVWKMGGLWNNEGTVGNALQSLGTYTPNRFKEATDGAYIRSFYITATTTNVPIPAGATIKIYAR